MKKTSSMRCLVKRHLKGTWGQSNKFWLKWSFFIIKRNDIYKKFQKFTCKPQLTYFVCSFARMMPFNAEIQFNSSRLCNFTSLWKMVISNIKLYYRRCFLHKSNKKCKENQGDMFYAFAGMMSHTLNAKRCNFITLWNLIKLPQNFVERHFSIQLTIIWHKNRDEALASNPL